jgi:hypothetical protein
MAKKEKNKKLPCKKHSRKMDADVKRVYQNVMQDNLDLRDEDNFDINIVKCIKIKKYSKKT